MKDKKELQRIIGELLVRLDEPGMHLNGQTPEWFVEAAYWVCYGKSPYTTSDTHIENSAWEAPMSNLVAKARAALDGVTPGPWDDVLCYFRDIHATPKDNATNARFIATARSLVPDMADRIEALEAEIARLREAERTAWEPPPAWERPFNFECLGWVYGGWDFVFWNDTHWVTRKGNPCTPGHFRPMPPAPKQEPH